MLVPCIGVDKPSIMGTHRPECGHTKQFLFVRQITSVYQLLISLSRTMSRVRANNGHVKLRVHKILFNLTCDSTAAWHVWPV